jgi:TonB-dependent starch-binding outer membrane protein SusC
MRKFLILLLCTCVAVTQLNAQNRTVSGRVVDDKKIPLLGVNVSTNNGSIATQTDKNGQFSISVPSATKNLKFTYINFTDITASINSSGKLNVTLSSKDKNLDEIVVTGYQKRRRADEAGAITTVKGSDIADMGNASLDKALQGAAAGVTVQANNGIPGGSIRINIRGLSSFGSGTAPLWVIDGVPFPTQNLSSFTQTNPLSFLNQSDIESIDILKDAASTAIYGSSGANGVILVTTKKGRNQKTKIGFNYYTGSSTLLKKFNTLNTQEYLTYRTEAIDNQQKLSNIYLTPQQLKSTVLNGIEVPLLTGLTAAQISAMSVASLDSMGAALPNTDWQDAIFGVGNVKNYELTVSGGNEKTQFYTSASYQINKSVITKTDFKRANLKIDVTNKVNDKLKVNFNGFFSTIYQNAPFAVDGSFLGNPAFGGALILPHNPIRSADGTYFGLAPNKLMGLLSQNVVAVTEYNTGYERTNEALANVSIEYNIAPWLTFRSYGGIDYRVNQGRSFRDPRTPDGFGVQGRGTSHADWFINLITTQSLLFNQSFNKKHNIDGVLGYEFNPRRQEGFSAQKTGFTTFQLPLLTAGGVQVSADEYFTENKKNGVFAAFNYNYNRKYIIGVTGRYDGSSKFGEKTKFGFFPSIKAAWNVDKEMFFKPNKYINALKIRASYGRTGNDLIGDYDALGTYASGALYNTQSGIFPNRLASSSLTWENIKETNFGFDLGLFDNRIKISSDIYDKLSYDILQNATLPSFTGWNGVRLNSGKLSNKGVELLVAVELLRPKEDDGLRWSVSFNYANNQNKVLEIVNGSSVINSQTITPTNLPIGAILTTKYAGVNAATGKAMWYDSLGNITYNPQAKDRYYAGVGAFGLPPITGGFSSTIAYKGVILDMQFAYQYGQLLSDGQYNFAMETSGRVNWVHDSYDYRWTTPGQVTHIPRAQAGAEPNSAGAGTGDRFLQKTDMIRLRSVTLSYDFNRAVLNKLKMSSARFYVQGGNLFTYTSFKGYDPEFVLQTTASTAAGIVPQSKNVTAGVILSF